MSLRPSPWLAAAALVLSLVGCATPRIRPETAVVPFPIEDVWVTALEVARDWEFKLDTIDLPQRFVAASKESTTVVGGSVDPYQRFGRATRSQLHDLRVSMHPRGDRSTVVEIVYVIDKVVDEEATFGVLNAIRDRLARSSR